ncbi:hypothetical protein [Natronosalvus halobius]|uniref:hypothetical protein n=1 Tax=Natronosalvus halobius TaxID=2953746 RepID=UPI00209F6FA6|nr:hypothetical protein [Natronosalvus halobius]USZ71716.1 hypothetical protein NGM15_16905 [Natronosalvus halobius]
MARYQTIVATLAVRVPVNATGDLVTAGARIVERVATVERVDDATVRGLEPGLNDTTVTLETRLVLVGDRGEDLAVVRRELNEGVGVTVQEVATVEVDVELEAEADLEADAEEEVDMQVVPRA